MAGGKRRYKRNPTAGGPRHSAGAGPRHSAGAGRRRSLPELPSFVSPTSVAAAFGPSSSGGRGCGRGGRRGAAAEPANAVPFSYTAALRPCPTSAGGATQALEVAIDTGSCADPAASASMYSYEVVGGIGLGFHGDEEEEEAGESAPHLGLGFHDPIKEEEMDAEVEELEEASFVTPRQAKAKGRQNGGFISIGGVRIYSEDTSSPESEGMGDSDEESDSDFEARDRNADVDSDEEDSDDDKVGPESDEDGSGSDSEEGLSIGDSSVDDEIVADYMEGIGGSEELLSSRWLNGMKLVDSDDDEMDTDDDEDGFLKKGKEKLEGYALMRASEQYGMKRPNSGERQKGKSTSGRGCDRGLASIQVTGMEDVMMVKDVRMANRSGKGPKASSSQLSRSWPDAAGKSKRYQRVPGEKKKQKKEHIAKKRRQRMLSRGVDLEQINTKLRKMVVNQLDMLCFQPMHSRDCSQVQRLASIYQLKSGCQGSGNKRFVTVTLTGQSSMPSADGQVRLDKLLGTEPEDYSVNWNSSKGPARAKGLSAPGKLARHSDSCGKKVPKKQVTFAERPVSFVSSGTMAETVTEAVAVGSTAGDVSSEKAVGSDSKLGTFETHTKGFGSKMMAKMGFIEGTGLGKDGQGILQPVQAIQRPKSLGLGVEFDSELEAAKSRSEPPANARRELSRSRSEPRRNTRPPEIYDCGTFERHTKGFGSKMMVRMGFVPGSGLGKDGQGIVNPLTAVRRPKSRGLGATDKY